MVLRLSSFGNSSSSNGFNIDIGTSGNTTVELSQTYPTGGYSITSKLSDSSMDIYAIAEDGTTSGYTSSKYLVASKVFNKLVIFGATANDILTFEYKVTASPSSSGNVVGAAPFISSISDSTLVNIDDTTVVYGGNFATNIQAYFVGSDNVERTAKSVIRSSISELIVTRPDSLPTEYSPYSIKLINQGISSPSSTNVNILSNSISSGSSPIWSTTSIDTIIYNNSYSFSLSATDADGGAVSYSIVSGSLPNGITLNSNGTISGTPVETSGYGERIIIFRATDLGGNYLDKQLSVSYYEYVISGGTITTPGDGYTYHTFTSTSTLVVNQNISCDILIVAGGGGTGWTHQGGGGGAGGLLQASMYTIVPGNYSVSIGAGGSGSLTSGQETQSNGSNSSLGSIIAIGGGRGGSESVARNNGGSGGGGSHAINYGGGSANQPSYSGFSAYAYAGGGGTTSDNFAAGGGGGAGGAGGSNGGSGGVGRQVFGNYYAGGGAPSNRTSTVRSGGLGGGGNTATSGSPNTGGGGGAASFSFSAPKLGGAGGSGIVIIRYPI